MIDAPIAQPAVLDPSRPSPWWQLHIEGMPDADMAMRRIYAWFAGEIIDRPPVRFMAHNAFLDTAADFAGLTPAECKVRWYDPEYQIDRYLHAIEGRRWHGETFPVYWPNLGPDVYAAFYGAKLHFGEVTSWSEPLVRDWDELTRIRLDMSNEYARTLDELTRYALERCPGKCLVGYTDLHPGLDCVAAWRDPQQLCLDMIDSPAAGASPGRAFNRRLRDDLRPLRRAAQGRTGSRR